MWQTRAIALIQSRTISNQHNEYLSINEDEKCAKIKTTTTVSTAFLSGNYLNFVTLIDFLFVIFVVVVGELFVVVVVVGRNLSVD